MKRLLWFMLGISPNEATFARRGFRGGDAGARERLEEIGRTFLEGYHAALEEDRPEPLALRLDSIEAEIRGFAFEGAAMGLALLDIFTPWKRMRFEAFLRGPGDSHAYMVHVGAGWVMARLPGRIERQLSRLDPLLRWLAVDGYGFHEGYFHWKRSVEKQFVPSRLSGYARRAFDQGLGRSLWFVDGADVTRLPATIAAYPLGRQADLWSGVGLACAYAGGVDRADIEALRRSACMFGPQLAQGAAFAAKARRRAGNPASHTELACEVLCEESASKAAAITDTALERLPADGADPAYEVWRLRVQGWFAREVVRL